MATSKSPWPSLKTSPPCNPGLQCRHAQMQSCASPFSTLPPGLLSLLHPLQLIFHQVLPFLPPTVVSRLVTLHSHCHYLLQTPESLAALDPIRAFSLIPAYRLTPSLSPHGHGGLPRRPNQTSSLGSEQSPALQSGIQGLSSLAPPASPPHLGPRAPALSDCLFPEHSLCFDTFAFFSDVSSFRKPSRNLQSRLGPLLCFCRLETPCITSVSTFHCDSVLDVCLPPSIHTLGAP